MLRFAITCVVLASSAPAHAFVESCILPSGSYEWISACSTSGGEILGCICDSADPDRWVIPAGADVRCGARPSSLQVDLEFSHSDAEILVEAGGSLTLEEGCALAVPGRNLTVYGSLRVQGQVLTHGDLRPSFSTRALIESADPAINTTVRVAEVVHCPGSADGLKLEEDCEGSAEIRAGSRAKIALCWPREGGFHAAWLARIRAGDVLAFWDPSQGIRPPRDVNAMYEIEESDVQNGSARCLIANVLQGSGGHGYGPEKREIRELVLSAPYAQGTRVVSVGTEDVTEGKQGVARWLTCRGEGASAAGESALWTQMITEVDDDPGGDTLRLLPGGFSVDLPAGTHCYVDYGWTRGDPVSVWRPAALRDGTPDVIADSELHCNAGAACDFDFAQLANRGRVILFGSSDIDNSWVIDAAAAADIVVLHLAEWTRASVSERVQMTSHLTESAHSVAIDGEGFEGGTLVDWHIRHSEDDYFVPNACTVSSGRCLPGFAEIVDQTLVLRRLRVGFMGCAGESCSILDSNSGLGSGPRAFNVDLDGLLAEDPGGEAKVSSSFYQGRAGVWQLRNLALVAGEHALVEGYGGENASEENTTFENVYDIGRDGGVYASDLLAAIRTLSNVSLIDTRIPASSGNLRAQWRAGGDWRDMLVLDPRNNHRWLLGVFDSTGPLAIRDLAIVGLDRLAGSDGFAVELQASLGETDPIDVENLTLALRPGQRAAQQGAVWLGRDDTAFDSVRSLRGLLVANFAGEPAGTPAAWFDAGDLDGMRDVCMQDNERDGAPFPEAEIGGSVLRDAGLIFTDPLRGNFRLTSDSPGHGICGARAPGAYDMWALRVLHHDPHDSGDSWKTGPCDDGSGVPAERCVGLDADLDGRPDGLDNCPEVANPGQDDGDGDGVGDACDLCPSYASSLTLDTDQNGIGDVCECGDQSGDGRVDVADLFAIMRAIFDPGRTTALCDTNYDGSCNVSDLFGARDRIFGLPAYCSRYPPPEGVGPGASGIR